MPSSTLHEEAEVGEVLHLAGDVAPDRVVHADHLPGVGLGLLEPEGDAMVDRIDVEDLDVDLLADLEDLGRMRDPLRPRHLGDVDEPLDALLQLDEGAVVGEAHDLAVHAHADRESLGDARPRIGHDLLHAERHALALGIVLEHDHANPFADVDHLRRVADAAPGHVRHVQQTVDAAEVDEGAVVGDVLDRALENDALFEHLERLLLEDRRARVPGPPGD